MVAGGGGRHQTSEACDQRCPVQGSQTQWGPRGQEKSTLQRAAQNIPGHLPAAELKREAVGPATGGSRRGKGWTGPQPHRGRVRPALRVYVLYSGREERAGARKKEGKQIHRRFLQLKFLILSKEPNGGCLQHSRCSRDFG